MTVEAGVMGVPAPWPYSRSPLAVSMTTAARRSPRAGSFSSGPRVARRAAAALSGVSRVSGAELSTAAERAARTAGALGAGAGPDGAADS
ncbi:hypothetical protein ACVWZD_001570 [Streptomyces sp. TE3672]